MLEPIGQVIAGLALLFLGLQLASTGPRDVLARGLRRVLALVMRDRWGGLAAKEVIDFESRFSARRRALFDAHLARLERGVPQSLQTSTIHLDLLANLRQAHAYIADIVRVAGWQPTSSSRLAGEGRGPGEK